MGHITISKGIVNLLDPMHSRELPPACQRILEGSECYSSGQWVDCCEFSSSTHIYDNCEQEGKTYASLPENSCKLPPQVHTVNVQDVSGECKTANNLKFHLKNTISTVRDEYRVCCWHCYRWIRQMPEGSSSTVSRTSRCCLP